MRMRLVGYSGARPPVPGTTPITPEDPENTPDPPPDEIPAPLVLVLNDGDVFHKSDYLTLGYNRFDVMCIGGAGGRAGRYKQSFGALAAARADGTGGDLIYSAYRYGFGGAGGGGGVHRVKGRLALLPTLCPVVVGQPGADGGYVDVGAPGHDWHDGDPAPTPPAIPPGGDGGVSSFGGVICRASGGKGGDGLFGGAGGVGNADGAGGGLGVSWTSGVINPVTGQQSSAHMNSGTWDSKIGQGGAGGNGSVITAFGSYPSGGSRMGPDPAGGHSGYSSEADGAKGSYSTSEPNTSGPGDLGYGFGFDYERVVVGTVATGGWNSIVQEHHEVPIAIPGAGGGGRPFLINGEFNQYGSKAGGRDGKGAVIVRLSYAIV